MSYTLNYTGSEIDDILDRAAPGGAIDQALAAKQDVLTFDAVPTQGSTNPAESGGIYDAIQAGGAAALAAFATDSVSGDVVSFPDGADGIPVKAFTGSIVPVQSGSGDPSPDNVRPISGWSGAEIYRIKMEQGSYSAEAGNIDVSTRIRSNGWIKQTGGAITVTLSPSNYEWIVFNADSADGANAASIGGWSNSGATGTVLKQYVKIIVRNKTNPSADITPADVVVKIDGIDPTVAITFGQTVYGGSINATTGVLTIDWVKVTLTGVGGTWGKSTSYPGSYYISASGLGFLTKSAGGELKCSHLEYTPVIDSTHYVVGKCALDNSVNLYLGDASQFPTTQDFTAYLAAQYAAGTPVEISGKTWATTVQLDPVMLKTLLGANTVWLDCGSVTGMTYRADTALYIDKKLGA